MSDVDHYQSELPQPQKEIIITAIYGQSNSFQPARRGSKDLNKSKLGIRNTLAQEL